MDRTRLVALLQAYYPVLWNTFVTGFGSNAAGTDRQRGRSICRHCMVGRERAAHLPPNRFYTRADRLSIWSQRP